MHSEASFLQGTLGIVMSLPVPAEKKHPEYYDAASTMLHHRDGISLVMGSAWFSPNNMVFGVLPKELNFGIIRPENPFPLAESFKWLFFFL